jgi:hypothetical protein
MPCPQIDGNLVHGWLPFDALRARYCLRHGLPRPRSGGSQPPLLVEQGQPLAAAAAPPSERGRGQDRDTPRREAPKHGAPRNEGSLDAQAERRLPGTTVRVLAGDFARAPPLHPFFPVLPRSGPPHAAGVRSAVAALRYARSCQASQVNSAWGGSRAGAKVAGLARARRAGCVRGIGHERPDAAAAAAGTAEDVLGEHAAWAVSPCHPCGDATRQVAM